MISICLILHFTCIKSEKITLQSSDGSKKLVYDCSNFKPQAETIEDIEILSKYLQKVVEKCQRQGKYVTLSSLYNASKSRTFKTLERLIVQELCDEKRRK